ncbi:hypothetical protein [Arthrobacter mobilis]|uniref:Uncharacterized protein n=1 Tax=Arthrobacter mobilis TaxID=2724944 RepID=A0A7X6HFW5_9MICC|nr:hypothetical protein [Arthrobacter mobilis]NKX56321.1 hypothetical protein [Arthrobacter mobilis]
MADDISFSMTATPRPGGEQTFRDDIMQLAAGPVGGASFTVEELTDASATLAGTIPAELATSDGELASYLRDEIESQEGISLDVEVTIKGDVEAG